MTVSAFQAFGRLEATGGYHHRQRMCRHSVPEGARGAETTFAGAPKPRLEPVNEMRIIATPPSRPTPSRGTPRRQAVPPPPVRQHHGNRGD